MRTLIKSAGVSCVALLAAGLLATPLAAEDGATAHPNDPLTIIVSLPNQRAKVYRGTSVVTTTAVSTGKRGYATKAGVYSILEKRRRHYSNLYAGAPMPWMQRLTWTGTALHAGQIPGYPASHGCIRLPYSFAPKLFKMTEVGAQVVVAHSMITPKPIAHPALFQPLPPPMPPELLTQDAPTAKPMRKSSIDASPARPFRLPVILAKSNAATPRALGGIASAKLAADPEITGSIPRRHGIEVVRSPKDTTRHAIDTDAAPFEGDADAVALNPSAEPAEEIVAALTQGDALKNQDRLIDREAPKDHDRLAPRPDSAATIAALTYTREPEHEAASPDTAPGEPDPVSEMLGDATPEANAAREPAFSISADTLKTKANPPVAVALSVLGVNAHPPRPLERPSVMATRLKAGTKAAAFEAAEPISQEPLRILVTRRTTRDRTVDLQYILSDMGYLPRQNFDGTRGSATIRALKAFQRDNDMPVTGALTDDVFKKVYEVAGKKEPSEGQLFVRQKFASVFSTPVSFSDPDKPLGTHLFTVMHFEPGATKASWTAISLNDQENAESVLNRISIPADVRQRISERLTPGSSLIVADTAINSAALPKGADFLVWDTSKPQVHRASVSPRRNVRRSSAVRQRPTYRRERYRNRSRFSRRSLQRRRGFGF
jgi:peptidoglycan hydrolase-like protein with peptidoglycan-binding domain